MPGKLAVIAGGGNLPLRVIEAAQAAGREVFVLGVLGQAEPAVLQAAPSVALPVGAARRLLKDLRQRGIEEVVLAGKVTRPTLREIKLDWVAAKLIARATFKALGDDGLLRSVIKIIETEGGARVVAPQDIMQDLRAAEGVMGRHAPDATAKTDIRRGIEVAMQLGRVDVGQSVVVQQGIVLGVEAIEGTDALVRRCAELRRKIGGGVLIKISKPQQDRRADPPVIGPATIATVADAGLAGIAVEAGGVLVVDRPEAVRMADEKGVFLLGTRLDAG
jgi:DUF1009 family protein